MNSPSVNDAAWLSGLECGQALSLKHNCFNANADLNHFLDPETPRINPEHTQLSTVTREEAGAAGWCVTATC